MKISILVAVSSDGVIGRAGELPWRVISRDSSELRGGTGS